MLIAIDFDGTCVEHDFPKIGNAMPHARQVLRALVDAGHKLILWTCREDNPRDVEKNYLALAVRWFDGRGIPLAGVNQTPRDDEFRISGECPRKAFAHIYIDDRNLGGFPGWDIVHEKILGKVYASNGSS